MTSLKTRLSRLCCNVFEAVTIALPKQQHVPHVAAPTKQQESGSLSPATQAGLETTELALQLLYNAPRQPVLRCYRFYPVISLMRLQQSHNCGSQNHRRYQINVVWYTYICKITSGSLEFSCASCNARTVFAQLHSTILQAIQREREMCFET